MTKKLKDVVKMNPEPARGKLVDPSDPWAIKANIAEASLLHRYLLARGINPKFVSKDTKISHAKSLQFQKWKLQHQTEEVELDEGFDNYDEIAKELIKRHGKNVTKDHVKAIENERDSRSALDHDAVMAKVRAMGSMTEAKKPKMTALDKFRKAAAEREKKHAEIEKKPVGSTAAIDRLEKHLNKEETDGNWLHPNKVTVRMRKANAGVSKAKETSFHKKLDKLVHSTFGKRKDEQISEMTQDEYEKQMSHDETSHAKKLGWKVQNNYHHRIYTHPKHGHIDMDRYGEWQHRPKSGLMFGKGELIARGQSHELDKHLSSLKEEVEQIDELKKSTVKSWLSQQPVVPAKKPGMDRKAHNQRIKTRSKSWDRALDRLTDRKPTSEDMHHDTYAATQMPFDGANNTNDTSMKREMSKSARIIKSIYKRKNMKEETYDWEKDDKAQQPSMGKKEPKIMKTDEKKSFGENKPEARIVMTGGTTLTGEPRDTVEIDPNMKNRPGPDAFEKSGKKSPNP